MNDQPPNCPKTESLYPTAILAALTKFKGLLSRKIEYHETHELWIKEPVKINDLCYESFTCYSVNVLLGNSSWLYSENYLNKINYNLQLADSIILRIGELLFVFLLT